jgi:hypothetical protein
MDLLHSRTDWILQNYDKLNYFIFRSHNQIKSNSQFITRNTIYYALEGIFIAFYYRSYFPFLESNLVYVLSKQLFHEISILWNDFTFITQFNILINNINNTSCQNYQYYDYKIIKISGPLMEEIDKSINYVINNFNNNLNTNIRQIQLCKPYGLVDNPFYINPNILIQDSLTRINNNQTNFLLNQIRNTNPENNNNNIWTYSNIFPAVFNRNSINTPVIPHNYHIITNNNHILNINSYRRRFIGPLPENINSSYAVNNISVLNSGARSLDDKVESALRFKRKTYKSDKSFASGNCIICLEDTNDILSCGHSCHQQCLIPTNKMSCPMCKREVELDESIEREFYKKRILSGKAVPLVIDVNELPGNTLIINWI